VVVEAGRRHMGMQALEDSGALVKATASSSLQNGVQQRRNGMKQTNPKPYCIDQCDCTSNVFLDIYQPFFASSSSVYLTTERVISK